MEVPDWAGYGYLNSQPLEGYAPCNQGSDTDIVPASRKKTLSGNVYVYTYMYIYIYMYIHMCVYIYVYVYIYI